MRIIFVLGCRILLKETNVPADRTDLSFSLFSSPLTMSATAEEPELQNGHEPKPKPKPEIEPESEPEPSELEPKPVAQPEPEAEPAEPESEPEQPEATDADPKPEEPKQSSIQSNEATGNASVKAPTGELRKDEGSRTFTMRELLSGLKADEADESAPDATSPYRSVCLIDTFSWLNLAHRM
jgi:outer membrane biosynthesis protein TonB